LIFIDTNVISETLRLQPEPRVLEWLTRHDSELAIPSIVVAEIAFAIHKLQPDRRAKRLMRGLDAWRQRLAGRIMAFNEESALIYGELMGASAKHGRAMSAQDGMIAAIARVHAGKLATRNVRDFEHAGVDIVNPWSAG